MRITKKTIYNFILPALLMPVAACSDSMEFDDNSRGEGTAGEVTLMVELPEPEMNTRADLNLPFISSGSMIDRLIFTVYEEKKDNNGETVYVRADGFEENIMRDITNRKKVQIHLSLDYEHKKYRVVFWAQSSQCYAFDTSNLLDIKVSYNDDFDQMGVGDEGENVTYVKPLNNSEVRDAFAGASPVLTGPKHSVILHRVMSQINVATTGADYKNLIYDKRILPSPLTITESAMTVKGVANRYNALTGEAKAIDEVTGQKPKTPLVAEFDWDRLPAWINSGMPAFPTTGGYGDDPTEYNPFVKLGNNAPVPEEFLKVSLNGDNIIRDFKDSYPTLRYRYVKDLDHEGNPKKDADGNDILIKEVDEYLTETFKYLSMCYVLVPSSYDKNGNVTGSTVNVIYNLRQNKKNGTKPIELTGRDLKEVPAQANFRTNILGGLYTEEEPDPTSIFNYYQMPFILMEEFFNSDYTAHYYSATLTIMREDPTGDGLSITPDENGKEIATEGVGSNGQTEQLNRIPQTLFFTNDEMVYKFTVKNTHKITIAYNVDRQIGFAENSFTFNEADDEPADLSADKYNWWLSSNDNDDEETVSYSLHIFKGATAGSFTLTVSLIPPDDEDEKTEEDQNEF